MCVMQFLNEITTANVSKLQYFLNYLTYKRKRSRFITYQTSTNDWIPWICFYTWWLHHQHQHHPYCRDGQSHHEIIPCKLPCFWSHTLSLPWEAQIPFVVRRPIYCWWIQDKSGSCKGISVSYIYHLPDTILLWPNLGTYSACRHKHSCRRLLKLCSYDIHIRTDW